MIFYCLQTEPAFNDKNCPVFFFDVIFFWHFWLRLLDFRRYNIHRTIIASKKRRNHTSDRFSSRRSHMQKQNDCPRTGLAFTGVHSLLRDRWITGRVWNNDDGTVGILAQQSLVANGQIHPRNSQLSCLCMWLIDKYARKLWKLYRLQNCKLRLENYCVFSKTVE